MYSLKFLSYVVGKLAELRLPVIVRIIFFSIYCKYYKVNRNELGRKLTDYKSFQEFFTREMPSHLRPINDSEFVSPVDGLLVDFGQFEEDKKIEVKSFAYFLKEFLPESYAEFIEGLYLILYLSPKDYHRIHSPSEGILIGYQRLNGHLRTVNPSQGPKLAEVLATNERVVSYIKSNTGIKYALVKVGATNVGCITFTLDNDKIFPKEFKTTQVSLVKGQEIAKFNLGSTVVICFPKNSFNKVELKIGKHYKMGEKLELS